MTCRHEHADEEAFFSLALSANWIVAKKLRKEQALHSEVSGCMVHLNLPIQNTKDIYTVTTFKYTDFQIYELVF